MSIVFNYSIAANLTTVQAADYKRQAAIFAKKSEGYLESVLALFANYRKTKVLHPNRLHRRQRCTAAEKLVRDNMRVSF